MSLDQPRRCRCGRTGLGRWKSRRDIGKSLEAHPMSRPAAQAGDVASKVSHRAQVPAAFPIGPFEAMDTGRRYHCAGCSKAVVICSHCDRGQRYCSPRCSQQARRRLMRAAGCRYQNSPAGRRAHAERQRRYRARCAKVTHQGSPPGVGSVPLSPEPKVPASPVSGACWKCHRPLSDGVRQDFLHSSVRTHPPNRREHAPHARS